MQNIYKHFADLWFHIAQCSIAVLVELVAMKCK